MTKVIKEESKKLGLLEIDDLFTYDTQLGMVFNDFNRLSGINDDLFTYEIEVPKPTFTPCVEQRTGNPIHDDLEDYEWKINYEECEKIFAKAVILIKKRLVRLIDVTVEQWSYKQQFEDYLEIKKQRDTYTREVDMEYNPSNLVLAKWLAPKFYNHLEMDWYTKNALWIYWMRRDNEVVLSDKEVSDIKDEDLIDESEIAEIFRIETDIFNFKTPLCSAFNAFNYLLKIDTDLLTNDILGFKTYNEFKDEWMNEWNKGIPWVPEEPWSKNGIHVDDIHHIYKPFHFKMGKLNGPLVIQMMKDFVTVVMGNATHGVINFCAWLKRCFGNFHELDYELLVKLEEFWWKINDHECSPFTNWRNRICGPYANANLQATYDPYLDINRIFGRNDKASNDGDIQDIKEPRNNHDMKRFKSNMARNDVPYFSNEEKEQQNEERCELFDDPAQGLPVCKIKRFELIKYSFEPVEKYIAI
ncbi:hypothetical protein Tco_0682945 [Tanacetum coccineum]|uniref:Uncharacterized protein n=1 Tax=Tanacetum coccineum TaxID=301880 RepID=A0ABQ4XU83_9ASTR